MEGVLLLKDALLQNIDVVIVIRLDALGFSFVKNT